MHKPMRDEALYSKSDITWTEGKKRKENKTVYSTSADTQYHFTPSRKTHRGKPKCHRVLMYNHESTSASPFIDYEVTLDC